MTLDLLNNLCRICSTGDLVAGDLAAALFLCGADDLVVGGLKAAAHKCPANF
jgi:hypothetical protein